VEYHWYYRPQTAPPVWTYLEELTDSERICVACTQTDLSAHKQAALVREWCKVLPTLHHVKTLWLTTRVPQDLFDAACRMPNLEDLWIKWSGITDINAIQGLAKLRYFHLGSSTGLRSIQPVTELTRLKWLGLENLRRIRTIEPVGALTQLEGLALEGSIWSNWKVRTLMPLSSLIELKYLALAGLRADDHTLAPLFHLRSLETLILAKWWDQNEVQEVHRRNPRLAA